MKFEVKAGKEIDAKLTHVKKAAASALLPLKVANFGKDTEVNPTQPPKALSIALGPLKVVKFDTFTEQELPPIEMRFGHPYKKNIIDWPPLTVVKLDKSAEVKYVHPLKV